MAIFRLEIRSLGRSSGRRATSAAAYRSGERIRDARTGRVYDHTGRTDVLHKEIVLPAAFSHLALDWAADRSTLWNSGEQAEKRSNSRVAREFEVSLPSELTDRFRLELTRAFAHEVADRYNIAVDMAIHAPRQGADPRSYHAHILATTREVTGGGLGAKASLERPERERLQRGLLPSSDEFKLLRARWAELTNETLREAGIAARVDHRSLAAQGIDREPGPSIPHKFIAIERMGVHSTVADQIRENYRQRVLSRAARSALSAREVQGKQRRETNLDDVRRAAAQAWLRYRERDSTLGRSDTDASKGHSQGGRDEDHSL